MQEIELRFFRPDDAPGVARLFRSVYGEGYPVKIYYRPDELIAENEAGRVISTVARAKNGEIVGHDALVLLGADARLYENAAGAVHSAYRGQGIFFRLMNHSIFEAAKHFGLEEILGEPVCNHLHLQKMCAQMGYRESGLEVDLMPATAYTREQSATGRVSVLLGYFLHKPVSRTVYLPPVYLGELQYLYSGIGIERRYSETVEPLPVEGESRGNTDMFASAQVARMTIHQIGSDFDAFTSQWESRAVQAQIEIFQIWLPLTSPFVTAATDILRRHGYFIGGILPNWHGGDGMMMQKTTHETDWGSIALYSERSKRIAEMVRNDQKRVISNS